MKTGITRSETAETFLISELKLKFDEGNRPLVDGTQAKLFGGGGGEEACFFNHCKCVCNDSYVRHWQVSERGNALDVGNFGPEVFNGII